MSRKGDYCERVTDRIYIGKTGGVPFIRTDPDDENTGYPVVISKIKLSILISKLTKLTEE